MTDDVGFGASSTFGGPIPTPTFEKLANAGLRFNNFHTTALCSPDAGGAHYRAQPPHLCHRRHHGDGHGLSRLQHADAEKLRHGRGNPQAERLQHVMVRQEPQRARLAVEPGGAVRPLAHRPGLRIFLRLHRRRHRPVASSPVRRHQTHRGAATTRTITWTADLADHAIAWIRQQHSLAPDKPFFVYYTPGLRHAPHHAPKEWIAKFKGQFDQGWDKVREETLARQIALGVVPAGHQAHSAARRQIPAWDSLQRRPEEGSTRT